LFIRDYGRHDLAQLRIKKQRLLDPAYPGLYIRGDGTRVYFFPKTELESLVTASPRGSDQGAMFEIESSGEDRRMVSLSSYIPALSSLLLHRDNRHERRWLTP
jgi:tRNAThr (cytosine32-N3)-methyltransferase